MKRKEFWIKEGTYIGEPFEEDPFYSTVLDDPDKLYSSGYSNNHLLIHVVDMASYNRLLEEARVMREAISFYSNPSNWDWPVTGNEENSMIVDDFYTPEGLCDERGGKKAKEALKRFDKFLKDEGGE